MAEEEGVKRVEDLDASASRTVVTLDGPAGVGKSSTARAVAQRLGYRYLDSGALYRAVTFALLESELPEERWAGLSRGDLEGLGIHVIPAGDTLELRLGDRVLGEELRRDQVTARVSTVARVPAVRQWLMQAQRSAASTGRLVADGRDMGTVVFPGAWAKVFLTADVEERARRRLGDRGVEEPTGEDVRSEAERLSARDHQDRSRELAPLRVPEGALVLDTTRLSFPEQVERITRYARSVARAPAPPVR